MNASGCVPTLYLYCPSHGLTPHVKTKHRHDTRFGLFVGSKTGVSDGMLVVGDVVSGASVVGLADVGEEVDGGSVMDSSDTGLEVCGANVIGLGNKKRKK